MESTSGQTSPAEGGQPRHRTGVAWRCNKVKDISGTSSDHIRTPDALHAPMRECALRR